MTFSEFKIFLIIPFLFAAKCDRAIKFDPDWHMGDSVSEGIVNERNETTLCFEQKFNEFSCMHRKKVCELVKILQEAGASKARIKKAMPDVDCF